MNQKDMSEGCRTADGMGSVEADGEARRAVRSDRARRGDSQLIRAGRHDDGIKSMAMIQPRDGRPKRSGSSEGERMKGPGREEVRLGR